MRGSRGEGGKVVEEEKGGKGEEESMRGRSGKEGVKGSRVEVVEG